MKRTSSIILLALASVILGTLAGTITGAFLHAVAWGQEFLWNRLTPNLPLQGLFLCSAGGLLVGLCHRYLGDYPKSIYHAINAIRENGRLGYRNLHKGALTAFTSLVFGASLGPEAAIVDLLGGMVTWAGDIMQKLRTGLQMPQAPEGSGRFANILRRWPLILTLAACVIASVHSLSGLYGGGFLKPAEPFHWSDLLWSIPVGLAGAAAGWLYLFFQAQSEKLAASLKYRHILRSLLGGLALGLAALFLPMVLFSGQLFLQPAYDQAVQIGFWVLLLTGLARLFLTALMLATGWKGGQFLPVMFAGTVLGLSFSLLIPGLPSSVGALAGMAGLLAIILPKPMASLALMLMMFPLQYAGISVAAVAAVAAVVHLGKHLPINNMMHGNTPPKELGSQM